MSNSQERQQPTSQEASFILHVLRQRTTSTNGQVDWERTAAADELPSGDAEQENNPAIEKQTGWDIVDDPEVIDNLATKDPTAEGGVLLPPEATKKQNPPAPQTGAAKVGKD
ncbi:hypothetical protein MMC16_003021 [Acarospora aff. strigata]|nr:hypothetical protein [Acarospora aff. strigata]